MPVQQQMSSFAKQLGGRVAQANEEHKDKPIDTGNRRLPSGIRGGIAKLSSMYTKEYEDGDNKGKIFFRVSAIVVSPTEHGGEKVAGMVTSQMVPLCDVPAKGLRKAKSFSENWFEFQNIFKLLGIVPCPETSATDPTGQRTEAYFMASMKGLVDPQRMRTNPVYVEFSTRGWTPAATALKPKPEEMVFEDWHGLASADAVAALFSGSGRPDPAAGVGSGPPLPGTFAGPPTHAADGLPTTPTAAPPPQTQTAGQRAAAPPPTQGPPPQYQPGGDPEPEDVVAALVEAAMADPNGETEDGVAAHKRLEAMAWAAGWTEEQTTSAADWAQVGDMALTQAGTTVAQSTPLVSPANGTPPTTTTPTVGSSWIFCKRKKDGTKLKNDKTGEEFPAVEVELVTVDLTTKTCTVKAVKDGKDVLDIRTKQPTIVKFEWLE